ncbi:hypothetical protein LR48_Vigan04g049800 [Vigna angularis]|uniref:Uncharacterized protein n=1 Tax=Phaseolus angularis TaxID=3914 RepID=A0A0L9UBI5_PHAAN|nr:hypothetical protein LR48_Vigan04g049800 [Vigna angularis]
MHSIRPSGLTGARPSSLTGARPSSLTGARPSGLTSARSRWPHRYSTNRPYRVVYKTQGTFKTERQKQSPMDYKPSSKDSPPWTINQRQSPMDYKPSSKDSSPWTINQRQFPMDYKPSVNDSPSWTIIRTIKAFPRRMLAHTHSQIHNHSTSKVLSHAASQVLDRSASQTFDHLVQKVFSQSTSYCSSARPPDNARQPGQTVTTLVNYVDTERSYTQHRSVTTIANKGNRFY